MSDSPPPSALSGKPTQSAPHGPSPARSIALRVLSDLREGRHTAREAIDSLIEHHPASAQDRGLATEIVIGVVRHRLTLARLLGLFTARGWQRVSHRLQQVLMIGAYQLVWLDGVPEFAAVDEAVEQAKREGGTRAGRFVNAVLRSLIRDVEHRRLPMDQADPSRSVLVAYETVCQFRRPFLVDPNINPVGFWSDATSHPTWMVASWRDAYGLDAAIRICRAGISRPPTVLRPNRLKIDTAGLRDRLQVEGVNTEPVPGGSGLVVLDGISIFQTRSFEEGLFQPQDRTAMEVLSSACRECLQPGHIIVDMCAGLGTKTTQLAELMQDKGVIFATDKDANKLELLRHNARRLGCQSVQVLAIEDVVPAVTAAGGAHCVLVDAPCSNTGVLARRPEARYRLSPRVIQKLAKLQMEVLTAASQLVRPGGQLTYVTCSIDPQENEQVASQFSEANPAWRFVESHLTLPETGPSPTNWHDGGYWAVWRKP